ncbi:MAG TPA: SDR family oxidoreductase [Acidimicrobiales bacterium]|jgi:3-oxoacyl-[acyl-carrier protein] reductase|nr:SDR family oxidoreductase [Acidimicrobiales bacterium]
MSETEAVNNLASGTAPPVVAITGATRGIGQAVSMRFAQSGAQLALCDLVALEEEARTAIDQSGAPSPLEVVTDVSDPVAARSFIDQTLNAFGRIDVLITCAGILHYGPSESVSPDNWATVLAVNLTGTFTCIQAALPAMLHQGAGRIITISSELGLTGRPEYAAYCASKGGVIALTKALAREYVGRGILINSVAPGPVLTDLLINSPEYDASSQPDLPIGRFGTPEEIAAMVHALAGEAGTFVVGQIISPNGGAVI